MSVQHKYKIDIFNPTNIEADVPKEQQLRQPSQDESDSKMADDLNKMADTETKMADDDSTFLPVFSSRKEEAVFTKGDLKLQKVQKIPNPLYSEVNGEVIHIQPIRVAEGGFSDGDNKTRVEDKDTKADDNEGTSAEKKPKSRIPTLRQAAEKVRRERRESSSKEQKEEVPTAQPRRSSIPRRRRQSYKSPPPPKRESDNENTQNNEENNNNTTSDEIQPKIDVVVTKDDEEPVTPEEFDKLYNEIIHTDESLPYIDSNVQLLPKVDHLEDPVSLENTFEEMMHDYEENNVNPLKVKDVKSKIPLLKQKSLPEGEFIKRIDRRQSLKDSSVDGVKTKDERKSRRSKLNEINNRFDRNAQEDLKEHKRLTKEILKREEANEKQRKDIISKYYKGKGYSRVNKNGKTELVSAPPAKPSKTDIIAEKNYENNMESVNVTTPVLHKQDKLLDETSKEIKINKTEMQNYPLLPILVTESDEMPKSTKIIQNIHKNSNEKTYKIVTDDGRPLLFENTLPAEKREIFDKKDNKQIYKIESDDGQMILIENTLPVKKREYIKTSLTFENVPPEFVAEEAIKVDTVMDDTNIKTDKPEIPIVRGKVSKLTSKFSSNEPHCAPFPKKEFNNNGIPKKKTIMSKIAVFIKDKNNSMQENKSITKPGESHIVTDADKKLKGTDKSLDYPKSKDELDIQRNVDKPKFRRTESEPLDIPNKFKIRSSTTTPPNTPQISFNPNDRAENNKENLKRFENASDKLNNDKFKNNQLINEHICKEKKHLKSYEEIEEINTHNIGTKIENLEVRDDHIKRKHNEKISEAFDIADNITDHKSMILVKDEIEFDQDFETHNEYADRINKNNLSVDKNEPYDRQPSLEAVNVEFDEKDVNLKGKVNKIINRIDSPEDRAVDLPKKEIDVPIKKSVLSRIAMFERQTSSNPELPNYQIKTEKSNKENNIPRIIEEVLKAPPPRLHDKLNINQKVSILQTNMDTHERDVNQKAPFTKDSDKNVAIQENIVQEYDVKILDFESAQECNIEESVNEDAIDNFNQVIEEKNLDAEVIIDTNSGHKLNNKLSNEPLREILKERESEYISKREKEIAVTTIEDRLKRIQSVNEENNLKKTKSVAEIDLGNAVKGKVHQLIKRMNSMEKLYLEKKKNSREELERMISAKERPKKKSVFEKIALFEQKSTSIGIEMAPIGTHHVTASTPIPETTTIQNTDLISTAPTVLDPTSDITLSAIYRERIEALKEAKEKYSKKLIKNNMSTDYFALNNGQRIPALFLGTAMLDPILLPYVVRAAIDLGFRGFDTAFIYGNEKEVGEAVRAKIADGTVNREDLFIIGKLWSTSHRTDLVEGACRASLKALGVDYFDLYLVHNPMSFQEGSDPLPKIANVVQYSDEADYLDAWFGMEGLVAKGLTKSIGVSNFNSEQIARVVEKGKIRPVVNQVECHPYLTQQRLDSFCCERNITMMCYGSLGSAGTPQELRGYMKPVIQDETVKALATEAKMTPAQLLLRFQIESGHPVVTKCSSATHLWENLQATQLSLGESTMTALYSLNKNKRTYALKGLGDTHRNYPFRGYF